MNGHSKCFRLGACAAALVMAGLAACGSSSGDDDAGTVTTLTLSGTASNGTALSGRAVSARCATGTGSATTGTDGAYSLQIEGGALPCLLETRTADAGDLLHSVAAGTGSTATAHLTPFTELVVAHLAGVSTADYFAGFGAGGAAAVTADTVAASSAQVMPVIASSGVDTSALGNVLTGTVSATAITTFNTSLTTAGLSLGDLSSAVATGSPNNPSPSSRVALPPELLLAPKASTCAALRSGTYRLADPHYKTTDEPDQTYLITVDATTLVTVDLRDNTTDTLVPTGTCRFTDSDGEVDLVVSQAGMMVLRYPEDGSTNHRMALAFPEQSHTLAELAGTWNAVGFNRESGDSAANVRYDFNPLNQVAITADGKVTAPSDPATVTIRANAAGGFDLVDETAGLANRVFALRNGGGELLLLLFGDDGTFEFFTPQRPLTLPTVGDVSASWTLALNTSAVSTNGISEGNFTILSVDAAANSWTRVENTTGVQNTFLADNPAVGFNFRAATTATDNTGATVTVRELTGLRLRGSGLNVSWAPLGGSPSQPGTLNISVTQP